MSTISITQRVSGNFNNDILLPGVVFASVLSGGSTQVEMVADADPNVTTVVSGTDLTFDASGLTGGTVTSVEFFDTGASTAEITGLSLSGSLLGDAIRSARLSDFAAFDAILDVDPVKYSATTVPAGGVVFTASSNADSVTGSAGDDTLDPGDNSDGGDFIGASAGDDTIVYSQSSSGGAFQSLSYLFFGAPEGIVVTIDGTSNTATVDKGAAGFDTIVDIVNPLNNSGVGIEGTDLADVFNVTNLPDQWMQLAGDAGNDIFNITSGQVRVDYRRAEVGINVDLANGTATEDGFGGTDTFIGDVWEIRGSDFDDVIIGSDNDESFIGREGDDAIDGGGGDDRLRFDRAGAADVLVDLAAGTASGTWNGNAFTYAISNIERAIGSSGNDQLLGTDGTNEFDGRDGNDIINPGDNSNYDFISGSKGNDTIIYSQSFNGFQSLSYNFFGASEGLSVTIDGAANIATVDKGSGGIDTLVDIATALTGGRIGVEGTSLDDTFFVSNTAEQWMRIEGGAGDDRFEIDSGPVSLDFRDALDGIDANLSSGFISDDGFGDTDIVVGNLWEIRGSDFTDSIIGSNEDESFIGREGDDFIDGRGGFDRLRFDEDGASDVMVDLAGGTASGTYNGSAFNYTIANIERVDGSDGDDVISGSNGNDVLKGRDGNDQLFGGDGIDELDGGDGDDVLNPGSTSQYDFISGSVGNDTIIYSQSTEGHQALSYRFFGASSGLVATIDGTANIATVDKGTDGLDTITDIVNPLGNGSFGIEGTVLDDVFNITNLEDQWMQVEGGAGNDTINVVSGLVRLDYKNAAGGVHVDLTTGTTSDDGFGDMDTFTGTIAEIRGSSFNDTVVANGGPLMIEGGDGSDTVVYTGQRSDFGHDLQGDGSIVVDKAGGDNDLLIDVERIDFEDGDLIYDLASPNVGLVYRIYSASFDRTPDEGGLRFWTDVVDQIQADQPELNIEVFLAEQFVGSDEFEQLFGVDPSNEEYVNAMYLNVLDRLPDQAGCDYWKNLLDQGYHREGVLVQFAQSDENREKTAPDLDDGIWVV